MFGDPAFDGLELQMADYRYNTAAKDSELTGGIYRAIASERQVYKPTEWNAYEITLVGSQLKVLLNGELIQDVNLNAYEQTVKRHDDTDAPPVKDGRAGTHRVSGAEPGRRPRTDPTRADQGLGSGQLTF